MAKAAAPLAVERGPPVLVAREALRAVALPVDEDLGPAGVAVGGGLARIAHRLHIPVAADARVEDLVGPVVVLDKRGERVARGEADFPFEAFAGLGHEALFDEVEHGVALDGRELGVERERPGEVHADEFAPVEAGAHEADLAHHRVTGLVPELAGHVDGVAPGLAGRLGDDAGHHLGHVDFAEALVIHHERLRCGRKRFVVEEGLGVDAHVVGIGEAFVAARGAVVDVRSGGKLPLRRGGAGGFGRRRVAVERAGLHEESVEQRGPRREGGAAFGGEQGGEGGHAVGEHFVDLEQRETAEPERRMVDEAVGIALMARQGIAQCRKRTAVDTEKEGVGRGRGEDLVEENVERGVRHGVEPEGRLAHLAHARAPSGGVFGAVVGVEAEGHFQFVDGLGREAFDEDLVEAAERPVVALQAGDAFVDGEAGLHGVGKRADAGERGKIAVGAVVGGVHGRAGAGVMIVGQSKRRSWENSTRVAIRRATCRTVTGYSSGQCMGGEQPSVCVFGSLT